MGATVANAAVARALFRMATSVTNVAAAIFWLKVRGGGREPACLPDATSAPPTPFVLVDEAGTGAGRAADWPG